MPLNIPGEKRERGGGALNLYIQETQTNPNESRGTSGRRRQRPSVTSLRAKTELFFMAAVKFFIRAAAKRGKLHQQRQLISLRD